jgi:hypothetical protein
MRREKTTEILRHDFTVKELADKAQTLAQACQRKQAAVEEKKAATSQYAERISTEDALIGKTSRELNQGWETRPIDCKIIYNLPNTGIKSIYRIDTEELVKTASMTNDELQDTLFQDPKGAPDPEKVTEENIRNFFGMTPQVPGDSAPTEVHGWKNGDWIVVAASEEFAQKWMEDKGHAEGLEPKWTWADPDTTVIKGLESFFGTDVIPLRRAIAHMEKEGIAFPMLLQIPAGYMEKLRAGKDPQKPDEPSDAPAGDDPTKSPGKGKGGRGKGKGKPTEPSQPTVEPPATDQPTDAGLDNKEPEDKGDGDSLEPTD